MHQSYGFPYDMNCILHNRVPLISESAVMGVQCEQEGPEHTTLGNSTNIEEV